MFLIQHLHHQYQQKNILQVENWQAEQGTHWLLIGESGSGKTTLLHLLAGLLPIQKGEIQIAQQSIKDLKGTKLDRFRAKHVGLIFQKPHLIPTLTVLQNLSLAQYLAGIRQNSKLCKEVLEKLQLSDKQKSLPHQLSQGEAQRVSVARAILNQPAVILADEPTASLDDKNALQVIELLKTQAQQYQATLLIATHDQRVKTHFSHCYELKNE
jgi:putative ABC transport system ATP-binding protein